MRSPVAVIFSALCATVLAACGGPADDLDTSSDTDNLSATTYSMEMVRADPSLAPGVAVPAGQRVAGHGRPSSGTIGANFVTVGPTDWLYSANQLGQFLNLADPAVYPSDKSATSYSRQPGDLFADEGKLVWTNIEQGGLGDCYFMASFVSVIYADNGGALSKNLIVPHLAGGKTVAYDVTFFQANGRKVKIEVDPDLLHSKTDGSIYYAASVATKPGAEEWAPSLVEKAYAQWHKSFKAIGDGGTAADGIFALTGVATVDTTAKDPKIVAKIDAAAKGHKAQVACTWGEHDHVSYANTGVYADHCYSLRGIRKSGSSVFVQLRNPWGPTTSTAYPSEPPTDGVQDGVFELPLATFQTLYDGVTITP
jgi:hypothetical protein